MTEARLARPLRALGLALVLFGCEEREVGVDAGPPDAGTTPSTPSTDHCEYVALPPNAHAGGTVVARAMHAGAAERRISIPLGVTLGAYTARSRNFGGEGVVDEREAALSGAFAPSVGIETWPRVRALAITSGDYDAASPTGDETIVIVKADLGVAYQGLTHELEARLGSGFEGKVLFAVSHSHSAFANYTGHSAMQVGFGAFRRTAYDAILRDMELVAREALARRAPARIGIAHDGSFDLDDRVTRDRREENDDLAGGVRDDHDLFVIRVDAIDGEPIALLPVFGMHGTSLGADNPLIAVDAPGAIERVLEDSFEREVVVMHLQGAGGDVAPAGLDATRCDLGEACTDDASCEGARICVDGHCRGPLCHDYAGVESVGWRARDAILAAWERAGEAMQDELALEMVTRSVPRGPEPSAFTVRDGTLSYAPFDGLPPDGVIWEDPETRRVPSSPIDEFDAPFGAALCSGDLRLPNAQLPGAAMLRGTPYESCLRLDAVDTLFESVLQVTLEEPPLCDTTRTTVSAVRLGEHVLVTLPGEPVTLLADRLRALIDVPAVRAIVIGYAQDHGGYMLTAEDWLRGGFEPTITFWGPLEGEAIMEQAARLVPLALSDVRDDGAAAGTTRVAVPIVEDEIVADAAPLEGTVPASVPGTLLTRLGRGVDAQPRDVARLESAYFTWIGSDPLAGTPRVVIEHETSDGFEPVRRVSGREVSDGDVLLTWTPDPLAGAGPRTHYWTAEWQAVGWIADATLRARRGAPLGRYRFRVIGPETDAGPRYELASDPFEVTPLALRVALDGDVIAVQASAPEGFRLIDLETGASEPAPLRGETVSVRFDDDAPREIILDATGHATLAAPPAWSTLEVLDAFGNAGRIRR